MKGLSLAALGRRYDLESGAIRMALVRPSAQCEQIIARFLETTPAALWPDRYRKDGTRKKGLHAKKVPS